MRQVSLFLVSLLLAVVLAGCATQRGEQVNAAWILLGCMCFYTAGYRWYSRFIAERVLQLDDSRSTPAERYNNDADFVPTHKWVLFGHHFAAISGPGPLIGPVLAAQLGYLPSMLWLPVGAVLGGCVQDFVVLVCSMRRDGKSLGKMAMDEVGPLGGYTALVGIFSITIILLAVVALVVVKALADSPWGAFTIGCTIPVALLMGCYTRYWRRGRVQEASLIGLLLILLSVWVGGLVARSALLAPLFTFSTTTLAVILLIYGFAASTLPVWLLLVPRDYLSTFVKLGTIALLAAGILLISPPLRMPALSRFSGGGGPVWPGTIFPFFFLTIACGAISGFHSLISSGTTPKLIRKESDARLVGYGSMLAESFVGIMALISACVLSPGVYFAINSPARIIGTTPETAVAKIAGEWGYPVTAAELDTLTQQVGEKRLLNRTGGAPTLAVGMAVIVGTVTHGRWMDLWYHFAIMFEALFILTTLDAGTRVARFMLQDLLGHFSEPLGRVSHGPAVYLSSTLVVAAWGYFLVAGVIDPLGGINSLWQLFGIANQMLASIALCVITTVSFKSGRVRYAWVSGLPLVWLVLITQVAAWQKVFSSDPTLGFLASAAERAQKLAAGSLTGTDAAVAPRLIFNDHMNAAVAVFFAVMVWIIIAACARECWLNYTGRGPGRRSAGDTTVASGGGPSFCC